MLEPSVPYTPEQNGAAERAGRTILSIARTLCIDAGLPINLWPHLVLSAIWLVNRTPSAQLNWMTPWEIFTGIRPYLGHLRTLGCRAYVKYHDGAIPKLQKMNSRAWIGYLIGYQGHNIFLIWNPVSHKVVRARDVRFKEDMLYKDALKGDRPMAISRYLAETVHLNIEQLIPASAPFDEPILVNPSGQNRPPAPQGAPTKSGSASSSDARFLLTPEATPAPETAPETTVSESSTPIYTPDSSHSPELILPTESSVQITTQPSVPTSSVPTLPARHSSASRTPDINTSNIVEGPRIRQKSARAIEAAASGAMATTPSAAAHGAMLPSHAENVERILHFHPYFSAFCYGMDLNPLNRLSDCFF